MTKHKILLVIFHQEYLLHIQQVQVKNTILDFLILELGHQAGGNGNHVVSGDGVVHGLAFLSRVSLEAEPALEPK